MTKSNTTTKKAAINSTAIAIIAAPSVAMDGLRGLLSAYHKADKSFESAQAVRARCVLAFADTCKTMGWADLTPIKSKGQHRAELQQAAAACVLNAAQLKAFNSDMAAYKTGADGKRVYSAKHAAGNIVNNFLDRLIAAAEKVFDNDAPSGKEGGAEKGANANAEREPSEAIADFLAKIAARIARDARRAEPKMTNHAEKRAMALRWAKEWSASK
jgi:hypothetical protein